MNALTFAINEVKNNIPSKILDYTFQLNTARIPGNMISIESRIIDTVVYGRVLPLIEILGGKEVMIPLAQCEATALDNLTAVYHVPATLTQNRNIVQVYEAVYGMGMGANTYRNGSMGSATSSSPFTNAIHSVVDAAQGPASSGTGEVSLVAPNTVAIRYYNVWNRNLYLRCRVANDNELNSIQPQHYRIFSQLVIHAVEAYIYNTSHISVDEGLLQGGQTLGAFRDILNNYADSEEKFQRALDDWRCTGILNDPIQKRRLMAARLRRY